MGAGHSAQRHRGREPPAPGISRVRGAQTEAKNSQSHATLLNDVPMQTQRSLIRYTSRLMRHGIADAYTFDFLLLRREDASKVKRVTCKRSGQKAEALVVRKHLRNPFLLEKLKKEIEIWLSLDHPHVARLLEVFEDDKAVYLVSEYCPGGSLYDCLAALRRCPEGLARTWALQMTQAIGFFHGCGAVHRNLRLESWQLSSKGSFPSLKLYGVSHSTRLRRKESRLNAACGALIYTSPDVLLGRYTEACDMWSLGVIVYQLLCGRPPFLGSRQETIMQILSGDVNLHQLEKAGVSDEAKSFVLQLLTISPHNRLTPQRALEHPWLRGLTLSQQPFPAVCTSGLLWFANSSSLRRACLLTCAYCLNSDESQVTGNVFAATTRSSGGCLTMEDLKRTLQREQAEPLEPEEVASIFDALDVDKDGQITFTAFAAAMIGTLIEPRDALLRKAFAKLDIDCDGRLSLDECRWAFGDPLFGHSLSSALAQEKIEDGHIDFPHFAAMIREKGKPMSRQLLKTLVPSRSLLAKKNSGDTSSLPYLLRKRTSASPDAVTSPFSCEDKQSQHPQAQQHRCERAVTLPATHDEPDAVTPPQLAHASRPVKFASLTNDAFPDAASGEAASSLKATFHDQRVEPPAGD